MPRKKKDEKKRTNGEGSIYQEAGRWRVSLYYEDATGTMQRKRQWADSERDAREKLHQLRIDLHAGAIVPEKETVGQFLERWLLDVAINRDERTAEGYRSLVRHYLKPALGSIKLAKLAPAHISKFLRDRMAQPGVKGSPLSARYVDHMYRCLHSALTQALREGLISRNPADAVAPPAVEDTDEVYLTAGQTTRLLLAAREHPRGGPVLLMVAAGMRWSEVSGLLWRNVDLEAGRLAVRTQLTSRRSPWRLKEPKRSQRRVIDLPSWAVTALREQQERQAADREKALDLWTEYGFVFTTGTGGPLHISNYWRDTWRPLLTKAGLTETGIKRHGLRHTHGVLLREAGEELDTIRHRLGHRDVGTTVQSYGHITPKLRRGPADRLEDLLEDGE